MSNVEQAAHLYIVGIYIKAGVAAIFLGALIVAGVVDYYRERRYIKEYEARKVARKQNRSRR
jgi:hypothetical protein